MVTLGEIVECFTNVRPLSVTIVQSMPHQQRMSLKIQSPRVFAVLARCSRKYVREQRPWTKYLKPPDFSRCIMTIYILVNKGSEVLTTG